MIDSTWLYLHLDILKFKKMRSLEVKTYISDNSNKMKIHIKSLHVTFLKIFIWH